MEELVKRIYIDFHTNRDRLEPMCKRIKEKQPHIFEGIEDNQNEIDFLISKFFGNGATATYYIFNNSMNDDNITLTIRPKIGARLSYLGETTLLFRGHLPRMTKDFIIMDRITDSRDSERRDFEREITATTIVSKGIHRLAKPTNLINSKFIESLPRISYKTKKNLEEWKDYLLWRRSLVEKKLNGIKYLNVTYEDDLVLFTLLCSSEKAFKDAESFLKKNELKAFNNNYSSELWEFQYNKGKNNSDKGIDIGSYVEPKLKGYVNKIIKSNEEDTESESIILELDTEDTDTPNHVEIKESYWKSIEQLIEKPYIAQVAFTFSETALEEIDKIIEDDKVEALKKKIMKKHPKEGFISISAAGDFALLRRQESVLKDLEMGEGYSPYLASWLFDITKVDVPDELIESVKDNEWCNKDMNDDQKNAINKLLNARDLFLIQGPPGTGKTTVIAEAIYQLVKRGKRILLSSQSNLAVDNVLERLAALPEIRTIRLGSDSKVSDEGKRFTEKNVIGHFYNSIANSVEINYFDKWNLASTNLSNLEKDIDKLKHLIENESYISNNIDTLKDELNSLNSELKEKIEVKQLIASENESNAIKKRDLSNIIKLLNGDTEQDIIVDTDISKEIEQLLININSDFFNVTSDWTNDELLNNRGRGSELKKIITKYLNLKENAYNAIVSDKDMILSDGNLSQQDQELLESKQQEFELLNTKLANGDDSVLLEWRNTKSELDMLRKQLSSKDLKLNQFLNVETMNKFKSLDPKEQVHLLDEIKEHLKEYISAFDSSLEGLRATLKDNLGIYIDKDIKSVTDEINKLDKNIDILRNELDTMNLKLNKEKQRISDIQNKYDFIDHQDNITYEDIEEYKNTLKEKMNTYRNEENMFGTFLKEWTKRLNDESLFENDTEYFVDDYVEGCNVVGVSCTENSKTLTDKNLIDFDVAIIDEVSKATPTELLLVMIKAKQIILVGDHRQLPPVFDLQEKTFKEVLEEEGGEFHSETIDEDYNVQNKTFTMADYERFKKMVTSSLFKEYFEKADEKIKTSLFTQYRMHSDIMDLENHFYEGRLKCGLPLESMEEIRNHELNIKGVDGLDYIRPDLHAVWVDSSKLHTGEPYYEKQEGNSKTNELEAQMIIRTLYLMEKEYESKGYTPENKKDIGVISFYGKQVSLIQRMYRKCKKDFKVLNVDINTVDKFQGKEKSIIMVSLVRNTPRGKLGMNAHVAAFERINVAFSRAKELLVVFGAANLYENIVVKLPNLSSEGYFTDTVYKSIINKIREKGGFFDSTKLYKDEEFIEESTASKTQSKKKKKKKKKKKDKSNKN